MNELKSIRMECLRLRTILADLSIKNRNDLIKIGFVVRDLQTLHKMIKKLELACKIINNGGQREANIEDDRKQSNSV